MKRLRRVVVRGKSSFKASFVSNMGFSPAVALSLCLVCAWVRKYLSCDVHEQLVRTDIR